MITTLGTHMEEIKSKVAGVSFKNNNGTSRQELIRKYCKPGLALVLQPDPANPHGHGTAVEILVSTPTGLQQIGFVRDTDLDDQIAEAIGNEQRVDCHILNITGGTKESPTIGVNVVYHVYDENEEPAAPVPPPPPAPVIPKTPTSSSKILLGIIITIGALLALCILAALVQSIGQAVGLLPSRTPTSYPFYTATPGPILPTSTPLPNLPPTSTILPPASSPQADLSRCVPASPQQIESIRSSIKSINSSNDLKTAWSVKSNSFKNIWFVSALIYGPGMADGKGPGVWAVSGDPTNPGMILSVDGFAKKFTEFPDAAKTTAAITMTDDGAQQSAGCFH